MHRDGHKALPTTLRWSCVYKESGLVQLRKQFYEKHQGVKRLLHSDSDGCDATSLRRRRLVGVVARATSRRRTPPIMVVSRPPPPPPPPPLFSPSAVTGSSRVCRRRICRTIPTSSSSTLWSSSAEISTNLHWCLVASRTPSVYTQTTEDV